MFNQILSLRKRDYRDIFLDIFTTLKIWCHSRPLEIRDVIVSAWICVNENAILVKGVCITFENKITKKKQRRNMQLKTN